MVIVMMVPATATPDGMVRGARLDRAPMIAQTLATVIMALVIAMLATLVLTAVSVPALVSAQITDVVSISHVFVTPTSPVTIAPCVVARMTARVTATATTLPAFVSLASSVRTVASRPALRTAPTAVSV